MHHKCSASSSLLHLGNFLCNCRGSQATPPTVSSCILISCSFASNKCQAMFFSRAYVSFISFTVMHYLWRSRFRSISTTTALVVTKILLFKRKWQMRVTECENSTNFSRAGVGRDRMQTGNATGLSICILQAVLLAKLALMSSIHERLMAPGSYLLCTVHHILKSLECLWATMSSHWLWEGDIIEKGPLYLQW